MKLTLALITTILPLLTSAQNLAGEPPCATACLSSAIIAAGCAPNDQGCPCGPTQVAIGTLVAPCLLASCPASLLGAVQSVGSALCAAYSLTAGGGPTGVSATVTATATATGAAVTSIVTATAGGNATTGSAVSPVSVSSGKGNLTVTVNTSGITALTTKTGSAGTTTAASAASASSSAGAGPNYLVGSVGGLAAGFVGLLAVL